MKCHTNINSTPFTQLPHTFSYIVAILGHNHFESPNMYTSLNNVTADLFHFSADSLPKSSKLFGLLK
jgi:hypothetical protein